MYIFTDSFCKKIKGQTINNCIFFQGFPLKIRAFFGLVSYFMPFAVSQSASANRSRTFEEMPGGSSAFGCIFVG